MKNLKIARIPQKTQQSLTAGLTAILALRGQCAMLHLSHSFAYDDEPLAEPVQNADINPEDPDGLLPATLEERSNGSIDLEQW